MALARNQANRNRWNDAQVQALITVRARTNNLYWYDPYGN
jgi:hypothetical protein